MNLRNHSQALLLQSTHRMTIQYHPELGHLYVPNLKARIPNEVGGYYVETNSQGFRSSIEFGKEKGNRPRILFFGDSNTAGDGVSNHERFSDLIGEMLGAEVYNYGLSGSGTDQQMLIFERFAREVSADLIVLCITVHNIERNKVAYRESIERTTGQYVLVPKPYFTLEKGSLKLHHQPVPTKRPPVESKVVEVYEAPFTESNKYRLSGILNAYDRSTNFKKLITQLTSRLNLGFREKVEQLKQFQPHPDYQNPNSYGLRLLQSILQQFFEKAYPVPVLVVPFPTIAFISKRAEPIYQKRFEALADTNQNVYVADVTLPLLELSKESRQDLMFRHDSHFSPFGHRKIADLIIKEIERQRLFPANNHSGLGNAN